MEQKKNYTFESFLADIVSLITIPHIPIAVSLLIVNWIEIRENTSFFIVFLLIALVPSLIVYLYQLYKQRDKRFFITSISRKNREIIFLIATASFSLTTLAFSLDELNNEVWVYSSMIFTILFGLFYLVNKYIDKASFHSGAFSFSILYLISVSHTFMLFLFFLPVIYWSRIKLHKHTWLQLMMGSVIGMVVGLISWNI